LSAGYHPTGSIVFTLTGPNGFTYSQTDTVSGNGTYSASATLPAAGAVAGTYTWTARYSGDSHNFSASDQRGSAEQTVVSSAHPPSLLTPGPDAPPPSTPPRSLHDALPTLLSAGYHPTGSIVFTLSGPGGFSYSQTDTVSGNGTYSASAVLPAAGAVAGSYTWTARYTGDPNNAPATDQGALPHQTTLSPAPPTLTPS